jgi:hypothetical protein
MQSIIALSRWPTGCGKMHFPEGYGLYRRLKNYQGTTLQAAGNSCFVSGHDFSRAEKATAMRALAPGFVFPEGYGLFRLYVNALQ